VLKESENDAEVSVYSDYSLDPFDDESPADKATREEEEKKEAGFQTGGGTQGSLHMNEPLVSQWEVAGVAAAGSVIRRWLLQIRW